MSAFQFDLLRLPAELRLHIYEIWLHDAACYVSPIANLPPTRAHASKPLYPVVLRLCKQTRDEARPVLYGGNTFFIRSFPTTKCKDLTQYFGRENAFLIRRVFTIAHTRMQFDVADLLERYEACGIKWDQLHLWATRVVGDEEEIDAAVERWVSHGIFVQASAVDVTVLRHSVSWFDFQEERKSVWIVKRDSRTSN